MKIKINYINLKIWIFPIAMFIFALVSYPFLPDEIARQWDTAGNVANMATKWTVFLPSIVCVFILIRGNIIPFIDPKQEGYSGMEKVYTSMHFIIMALLLFGQTYMILSGFGIKIPIGVKLFSIVTGLFLICIGNLLPKIPPTYLTGIKTVWAYGNEEIWTKTQRFTAKVWVISGLILIFGILLPLEIQDGLYLVFLIVMVVLPRIYSLILHNRMKVSD